MSEEMAGPRQRWLRIGLIVGAAVAVVLAAVAAITIGDDQDDPGTPDAQAYERLGAWVDGDVVHVGDRTAGVPGAIELWYTSEGPVVLGAKGYVLVTPAGEVEPLDLDVDVQADDVTLPPVATGADEPYLGYVRLLDETTAQLVVRDLRSGDEHAVGEPAEPGELSTPDSSWLWQDKLFYLDEREKGANGPGTTVDWRTGEQVDNVAPPFSGGVGLTVDEDGTWTVRDYDGEELLTIAVPEATFTWASLSPDGRFVALTDDSSETTIHDIASGDAVVLDGRPVDWVGEYGWTPDGHLIGQTAEADSTEVVLCAPDTGRCDGLGTKVTTTVGSWATVALVTGASASWP